MKLDFQEVFGTSSQRKLTEQKPRWQGSDEELLDRVSDCYHQRSHWDRELMKAIAEVERRQMYLYEGLESTEQWTARTLGWGLNRSLEFVSVAVALEELPLMDASFMAGRISYDHLRALCQVATPDNEKELLQECEGADVAHAFKVAKRLKKLDAEDALLNRTRRWCEMRIDHDTQMYLINAQLPEESGALLFKAIDGLAKQMPDDPMYEARPTPMGMKRADALAELAGAVCSSDPRYQVVINVDAESLIQGQGVAEIERGVTLSPSTVERLLCDSLVRTVVHTDDGSTVTETTVTETTVTETRARRSIPGWVRRRLAQRDPCCRFNGCTQKVFLEHHHATIESHQGGPATPDNLIMLCATHHRMVHAKKWLVRGDPPRTWIERPGQSPLKTGPPLAPKH